MSVIVHEVADRDAAVRALVERSQHDEAAWVRGADPGERVRVELHHGSVDFERRQFEEFRAEREVPGSRFYFRWEGDPYLELQHAATRAAIEAAATLRERGAAAGVSAFNRVYFGYDARWDLVDPYPAPWRQPDSRNFADGAVRLAHGLGGLTRVAPLIAEPEHLARTAEQGWSLSPTEHLADRTMTAGRWLALALGRTLRQCGQGRLEALTEAFLHGATGNI